jgi:membrane protease YdiL (CAAX protease family)
MSVVLIVFGAAMIALLILCVIDFFRYRKRVRPFTKFGLAFGLIYLLFELTLILPNLEFVAEVFGAFTICIDLIGLLRIIVFASVGMYCCRYARRPAAPVLEAVFRRRRRTLPPLTRSLGLALPATIVAAVAYSCVLLSATAPRVSETVRQLAELQSAKAGLASQPSLMAALAMLEFAFVEEIVFRLGIQNLLAKTMRLRRQWYWIAIILTAALWSSGHAGTLEPGWVKMAQIFPIGLALGKLCEKYGVESCIVAHGGFNLIMMFLAPALIEF